VRQEGTGFRSREASVLARSGLFARGWKPATARGRQTVSVIAKARLLVTTVVIGLWRLEMS